MAPKIDGRKLKTLREERYMKQDQLAARARITPTTVSRLENEQTGAQLETILRLAQALDVDPSEFVRRSGGTPLGLTRKTFPHEMQTLISAG